MPTLSKLTHLHMDENFKFKNGKILYRYEGNSLNHAYYRSVKKRNPFTISKSKADKIMVYRQ